MSCARCAQKWKERFDRNPTRKARLEAQKQRPLPATANNGISSCAPLFRKGIARWSMCLRPHDCQKRASHPASAIGREAAFVDEGEGVASVHRGHPCPHRLRLPGGTKENSGSVTICGLGARCPDSRISADIKHVLSTRSMVELKQVYVQSLY
jgi:hypothetical protein